MLTTPSTDNKQPNQNLYIRKLNGLGEKISVRDSLRVCELKDVVRQLRSLQAVGLSGRDFNLIYKGKNITQKSNSTLRQLSIPSDGIIHLVFANEQDKRPLLIGLSNITSSKSSKLSKSTQHPHISNNITNSNNNNRQQSHNHDTLTLRVIFNNEQHTFPLINQQLTVLQFKKVIAIKLNLVYQSLILSHLGAEMINQQTLEQYKLQNQTLISLKFNLNSFNSKLQNKKTLQTRMVSSVTFSDQNNQPNQPKNNNISNFNTLSLNPFNNLSSNHFNPLVMNKLLTSSSNSQDKSQENSNQHIVVGSKLTSMIMNKNNNNINNKNTAMYKSEINTYSNPSEVVSKAALMFKNALHQKIIQTQSVVSGQFSQQASIMSSSYNPNNSDPNTILITVRNQQQTKQFIFQCLKSHQVKDIRQKLIDIQRVQSADKLQISLQQDLFQSIDLNKSGCVTLDEIVKKMGRERAVFIYRIG